MNLMNTMNLMNLMNIIWTYKALHDAQNTLQN